jgi:hypothetical protein
MCTPFSLFNFTRNTNNNPVLKQEKEKEKEKVKKMKRNHYQKKPTNILGLYFRIF